MKPDRLLLAHVAQMEPYTPIVPFEVLSRELGRAPADIVKLDANENPYGTHPAITAAIANYPFPNIYPDPEQRELRAALAEYTGVPATNILPGHGADELIDLITRIFAGPGDAVIDCPPTFGMYEFDARLSGAAVVSCARKSDFRVDAALVEGVVRSLTGQDDGPMPKLLFLTSPNNPDGGLLPHADLKRLLEMPLMVVVDEAYVEFAGLSESVVAWVAEHSNLIVLRTFSKWAGMAGLRLGYGVFPDWLMPTLLKAKQPYNVGVAATVAGLAALAHRDEIEVSVQALVEERDRLYAGLQTIPYLCPVPSRANFVLSRVEGMDAHGLKQTLAREGILARHYARTGLHNYIRISAGMPAQTDAVLAALRALA